MSGPGGGAGGGFATDNAGAEVAGQSAQSTSFRWEGLPEEGLVEPMLPACPRHGGLVRRWRRLNSSGAGGAGGAGSSYGGGGGGGGAAQSVSGGSGGAGGDGRVRITTYF
jgi:hypothetical protein